MLGMPSLFPPANLPILLPDETLYSWCGQVHLWNGNASVLDTSLQLFGARYAGLLHDFPAHLGYLQQSTQGLLGAPEALALNHSLLGYFLAFKPIDLGQDILSRLLQGSYPQLKYKLGVTASRVGGHHPLKYCSQCLREEQARWGRGYWHLSHQLPSVFMCPVHETPLRMLTQHASPVHLRQWLMPGDHALDQQMLPISEQQYRHLLQLARISIAAARLSPGSLNTQHLAWTYQKRLQEQGLMTRHGSVRIRILTAAVAEHYRGLESLPGMSILHSMNNEQNGFIGSITRRRPRGGHPLKHLLLIAYLFRDWNHFWNSYHDAVERPPEWPKYTPDRKDKQSDPRLDRLLELVTDHGLSIRKAAQQVGISTTTATQWAKRNGIPYTRRTQSLDEHLLKSVRQQLRQGLTKVEIISTAPITRCSLNRLLAAEPELASAWQAARHRIDRRRYRQNWRSLMQRHPGLATKHLRKMPGNGYQWLYRHDRDWLTRNLPGLFHDATPE